MKAGEYSWGSMNLDKTGQPFRGVFVPHRLSVGFESCPVLSGFVLGVRVGVSRRSDDLTTSGSRLVTVSVAWANGSR